MAEGMGAAMAAAVILYAWIDAPLSARAINRRIDLGQATAEIGLRLLNHTHQAHGEWGARVSLVRVKF